VLIITERHTQQDITLWKEYEEADMIHSTSESLIKKEERAIEIIKSFTSEGRYYISVSWGKDSTTLLHLAWRVKRCAVVASFVRDPSSKLAIYDFNNSFVRDVFFSEYKLPLYVEVVYPETGKPEKLKTMRRFTDYLGFKKKLLGIRANESGERKLSAKMIGVQTEYTCRPLLGWSTQDVFSYLAKYKLPVHPVYGMLGGGRYERDRLRVDGAINGEGGTSHGRAEWEREYYPDILAKIEAGKTMRDTKQ
jgi:phosphoadenosine phosphosulfate reductase